MSEPVNKRLNSLIGVNLLLLVILWVDLFYMLHMEWTINAQYEYGWLVPLVGAYLIYLRSFSLPPPTSPAKRSDYKSTIILFAAVLCLYPLRIIFEANPEWRLVYWAEAILVYSATMVILHSWGGISWVKHLALAFCMFLFSVPWASGFEREIVINLMQMVANVTTSVVNICGIPATQTGTTIQLPQSTIGIEEACSGVRSLQSTLMSAFFFGELYRFSGKTRITLMLIGIPISMFFNLGRTLFLTSATYYRGADFMEVVHDSAGYTVAVAGFIMLFIIAILIKNTFTNKNEDHMENAELPNLQGYNWLNQNSIILLIGLYLFSIPATEAWYKMKEPKILQRFYASIDWDSIDPPVKFTEISTFTRAMLRYSEGKHAHWIPGPLRWNAFFFEWEEGMISSMAGVHRPEVCIPSQGYELVSEEDPFIWSKGDFEIKIKPYIFEHSEYSILVFFSVWDNNNHAPSPFALTAWDRITNAFEGKRISGRKQLMIVIEGATLPSISEHKKEFQQFLNNSMVVKSEI